jgi:hypothetical protein
MMTPLQTFAPARKEISYRRSRQHLLAFSQQVHRRMGDAMAQSVMSGEAFVGKIVSPIN